MKQTREKSTGRSLPDPVIFPKLRISPLPHHMTNQRNKKWELFQNIFPQIPIHALNPLGQPLKRMGTVLTSNDLAPQRVGLSRKAPQPFG